MTKPTVSLFGSAIRTELWLKLFENASDNKVSVEVVFVGSVEPEFDLPAGLRFIYSNVKPAQCAYIAMLNCTGQYLFNISDDAYFTLNMFDFLYETANCHDKMTIVSANDERYDGPARLCKSNNRIPPGPIFPLGSFTSQSIWRKMGIAQKYISLYWDMDMAMRFYQAGGNIVHCESAKYREILPPSLFGCDSFHDKNMFYETWTTPHDAGEAQYKGVGAKRRINISSRIPNPSAIMPEDHLFETRSDLLTVSQGPVGSGGNWV